MFGYVNVYKDELKIKDYNIYKAYYCGLCKALGRRHNQTSRLLLNYDFAFLALLCDSLKEDKAEPKTYPPIKFSSALWLSIYIIFYKMSSILIKYFHTTV